MTTISTRDMHHKPSTNVENPTLANVPQLRFEAICRALQGLSDEHEKTGELIGNEALYYLSTAQQGQKGINSETLKLIQSIENQVFTSGSNGLINPVTHLPYDDVRLIAEKAIIASTEVLFLFFRPSADAARREALQGRSAA